MKTAELIGPALDWAVAECEEVTLSEHIDGLCSWLEHEVTGFWRVYSPSTDWGHGGPIIEQEGIDLNYSNYEGTSGEMWDAACEVGKVFGGPTPLIAAMRCFVASKLGDEIEIPEELLK